MINFFRKIRKKLLSDNQLNKYLLYAFGEILLVVIGILIALQINNWNTNRITKNNTRTYLHALVNDLANDTLLIISELPEISKHFNLNEALRQRVAGPKATTDTLIKIARFEYEPGWFDNLSYNTNSYNYLIASGLIEEIPESLKQKINQFYAEKSSLQVDTEKAITDYRAVLMDYSNHYVFTNHIYADQGPLIDSLIWQNIDYSHLALQFNKLSTYKRILFGSHIAELNYSISNTRILLDDINKFLGNSE